MNADHARYAEWDAAYVLGALGTTDRAAYESHLAQCPLCRAAIAEIAPMPGLLSRVTPERAESLLNAPDIEAPTPEHRTRVLSLAAERARRRRRAWIAGTAAAAVIVVAAVVTPVVSAQLRPPSTTIALEQQQDAPLTASVSLTDVAWGTRLDMMCEYGAQDDAPADGWAYALVVISDDGAESVLSTWRAHPGTTARLSAGTELPSSDIAAVEIRAVDSGTVLMRSALDGS